MALDLENLDPRTRQFMMTEIDLDVSRGALYISGRLTETGKKGYPELLRSAASSGDDSSFAAALANGRCFRQTEVRQTQHGPKEVKVPYNAAETLAEGEFNRLYVRALCLRAQQEGIPSLEIYRAKYVTNPRPESNAKVGTTIAVSALLADLRAHQGVEPALGLPPGPNSGLSARLPQGFPSARRAATETTTGRAL